MKSFLAWIRKYPKSLCSFGFLLLGAVSVFFVSCCSDEASGKETNISPEQKGELSQIVSESGRQVNMLPSFSESADWKRDVERFPYRVFIYYKQKNGSLLDVSLKFDRDMKSLVSERGWVFIKINSDYSIAVNYEYDYKKGVFEKVFTELYQDEIYPKGIVPKDKALEILEKYVQEKNCPDQNCLERWSLAFLKEKCKK